MSQVLQDIPLSRAPLQSCRSGHGIVERLTFLDGFRAIAIVMVVGTHALDYTSLSAETKAFLVFWIQTIAVPPFFLADGFLFLRKLEKNAALSYWAYLATSARRLVVPWVIFSLIYAVFRLGFEYVDQGAQAVIRGKSVEEVAAALYYSSVSAQLYFLLSLFMVRMSSPLTRRFASCHPLLVVGVFFGYAGFWQIGNAPAYFEHGLDPLLNALWGMQYYLLGMVLYRYRGVVAGRALQLTLLAGLAFIASRWLAPYSGVLQQYGYLLMAFFMFVSLGTRDWLWAGLGTYTMEIYLLHAPIPLKIATLALGRVIDDATVFYYVCVTLLTFGLAYVMARLLTRTAVGNFVVGKS